ncbi:MAG: PKD domain-containing protein, partial [Bacteroidota bacterium]
DGGTSTNGGCTQHAYLSNGTYTVTLTANTSCGNQSASRLVVIAPSVTPHPSAWANFNTSCPGAPISFNTNGYSSYSWNFGDPGSGSNNTSTQQYPSHTYGTVGTYTVTLTVTNGCGKTGTASTTVSITNNPPFPNQSWFKLDVNSSPSCPNSNVGFNAPSGYNNYEWNFGDGSPLATTSNNYTNHTYGSSIGTYTVSVRVISPCGNDSTVFNTVVINNSGYFPTQNFQINGYPASCPNSYANFEAPSGYVSYEWNFGDGSPLETTTERHNSHSYGATLTTYTISVKITNGCGNDTTISRTLQIMNNLGFPTQQFNLETGPNPACIGDKVNWRAPGGFVSYLWDFGDGDSATTSDYQANHTYLSNGTYNGSVRITNGCGNDTIIYGSAVVNSSGTFPSNWLQVEANTSSCPNEFINFRVNQSGYQSYSWNYGDGSPVETFNVEKTQHSYTTTGTYTVTCTITNGCSNTTAVTAIIQVANNSPVNSNLFIRNVQSPSCPDDEVFFVPEEGQSNYQYVWNFGDGSPADSTIGAGASHFYSSTGTYTVSVLVTNGCGLTKAISLTQNVTNSTVPTLRDAGGNRMFGFPGGEDHGNGGSENAGCAGDNVIFYFMGSAANNVWDFGDGSTGTATESMLVYGGDGGAFPVTIIKHAFATNGSFMVKLTITNNCGNSVTDSVPVTIGGNTLVNGELTTSPPPFSTCSSIDFLGFGGSNYEWDFGDGGATLSTSSPTVTHTFASQGVYVVSVIITNGCGNSETYSKSVFVNGAGGPSVTLASSSTPTCISSTNGSATVTVTSGNPPYIYLWNDLNAQTTATATGLSAGLYNATVTDAIGCASTLAISINDPAPIILQVSTTTTTCGGSTGTASVSVSSGGTGPYTYQWSTGATGTGISGLSAGAYSVITTDINSCTFLANVNISESGGATLSVASSTNIMCNGASTGAIDLNVSGGNAPYTYAWSNGATVQDITGLSAGNYSVQVTDNAGCKSILNKTITQPAMIVVNTEETSPPTCGNFDGEASANVSGGTGPYTYLWDNNAADQTTQTATGLPAGTYTVTITDANGCTKDGEVSLSNSNAPNITAVVTDITCNGLSNGAINITVTGGTSPYAYTWNVAPPNTQDKTNLGAGNYIVFVNDAAGCLSFRSYTITQPDVLTVSASGTSANCSTNNGVATATPVGGNLPYSYLWSSGNATQSATGLSSGSYTVTVTDIKGCSATASTTISVAAPTPSICMVTVDDGSVNNIIYWDKTQYQYVDSFFVYREVSTGIYKRIAALKDTALSEYIDINRGVGPANGDPNVGAYRYKLQLRDSCGNYSALSQYHNTIYITDAGSGQFDWNDPYTIEGGGNPVLNYILICDSVNAENWFPVGTVSGTQASATDPLFASRPNTSRWRVKTAWGINCTPTRGTIVTTRSNIKAASISTSVVNGMLDQLLIYPNPASESLTIQYPAGFKKYQLQVIDALGQLVYNEELSSSVSNKGNLTKQLDVSSFRKGIYIINIQTESGNIIKRIAIQ